MIFEAFQNGVRKFWTEHPECIPSKEQLAQMQRMGYKFKIDGARVAGTVAGHRNE